MAALTWPLTGPGDLYNPGRVRKALFGRVDREKALPINYVKEMDAIMQNNKLRWNFDFENEKPLPPGRYLWERINKPSDTDTKDTSDASQPDSSNAEVQPSKEEQTHITDFMRKRKSSSKDFVTQPMKTRRRSST